MHPLTTRYARLVAAAYAKPGTWALEALDSGSVLSVRVTPDSMKRRADQWQHEVAVSRATRPEGDTRRDFDREVRDVLGMLSRDEHHEWTVAREGVTKTGGIACRITCEPRHQRIPT